MFVAKSSSSFFEKGTKYDFNAISRNFLDSKKGKLDTVVVEGVQAFKHALRFEAEMIFVFIRNKKEVIESLKKVIPAEIDRLEKMSIEISSEDFDKLSSHPTTTDILTLACKKNWKKEDFLFREKINQKNSKNVAKPIVFLEGAADLGNIGSALRASAAFGVDAFIVSGKTSAWHQKIIKSATGLHFAIPVLEVKDFNQLQEILKEAGSKRALIASDERGENLKEVSVSHNSVLVFGTERRGIQEQTKKSSDRIISLPMQKKVSSLNLATSVSAFLYGASFKD